MAVLKDIDKAAEKKGSFLVTVWQFVKFIVVSLLERQKDRQRNP